MTHPIVIARAFEGKPLKRIALNRANGLVYVADEDRIPAIEAGESWPVGFPMEDIYIYKTNTYENLMTEWEENGATRQESWSCLRPF